MAAARCGATRAPQPALSETHYMVIETVLLAGTTSGHPLRLSAPDQWYSVQSG
jgi:hypothetical protein